MKHPQHNSNNNNNSPAEVLLHTLLLNGPNSSREVLALMAKRQFTPKQVRNARERLGILAERSGNGADMRTTWRLPNGSEGVATGADGAVCDEGRSRLHRARLGAFILNGMTVTEARALADALIERDRHAMPAMGSCAECQCIALKSCPTSPRPAAEVHVCWYRRQCTP
jgi:hypothetical protein